LSFFRAAPAASFLIGHVSTAAPLGPQVQALLHFVSASGAAAKRRPCSGLIKAAAVAVRNKKEETMMRVLTLGELSRCTKPELAALLRQIAAALPGLPEGSQDLRNAHTNLMNIRIAMARPQPGSGPR
jgi:hypothetical protein